MITKEQKVKFLEKLGYKIEDITYTVWHDWDSIHEVSLAFVVETDSIKEFKEREYHTREADSQYEIRDYILDEVYHRQFEQALYKVVFNSIKEIAE